MHLCRSALVWSSFFAGLVSSGATRVLLENGASLPITGTFGRIEVVVDSPLRQVIVGRAQMNCFFVLIADQKYEGGDIDLSREIESLVGESAEVSIVSDGSLPGTDSEPPQSGLIARAVVRHFNEMPVAFVLVGDGPSIAAAMPDFEVIQRGFAPAPVDTSHQRKPTTTIVAIALGLLLANIFFLWRVFRRFATYATGEESAQLYPQDL